MEYRFSNRIKTLKPSAIREILKATGEPGMISFAAGNPAPEAFPVKMLEEASEEIFKETPLLALQYGVTEGYEPLKNLISELLKKRLNIGEDSDALMITSGATQVMELTTKVLCDEGDIIITESPSFIGSLNSFRSYGAVLKGIPMEKDGMDLEYLEKVLKESSNIKFLYTIPNFQNPTGITMSLEKRKKLYSLACEYDFLILEDNPYGTLRVSGDYIPDIKSFDTEGRVLYAGTFSKIVAPGIRVGYVSGPAAVLSKMAVGKQTEDVHTALFSQLLVYRWLTEYDLDSHVKNIRKIYSRKLNLMCDCLDKELGDLVEYSKPDGGLFLWCRLKDSKDCKEFVEKALKASVAVVPGTAFLTDEEKGSCPYVRINFSTPSDSEIVEGVRRLGEMF